MQQMRLMGFRIFNLRDSQRSVVLTTVPGMGDSISEGTLTQWLKKTGDFVERDEQVATIETDKVDIAVNSTESGTITEMFANEGDTVTVGGQLLNIAPGVSKTGAAPSAPPAASTPEAPKVVIKPAEPKIEAPKPAPVPQKQETAKPATTASKLAFTADQDAIPGYSIGQRNEKRVKMNRMRLRIAERLKESQNTSASLTTFNEIDMRFIISPDFQIVH